MPAWNSNIDTIDKLKNVSWINYVIVVLRLFIAALFLILYWKAVIPFWKERPVERDRYLFAHSGWGMAVYSSGAIFLVVFVLMTWANVMTANTILLKIKAAKKINIK